MARTSSSFHNETKSEEISHEYIRIRYPGFLGTACGARAASVFVVLFIVAYVIYGYQPQVGASADALVAFYDGDRTRILIAAVFSGMAVLNLLWFAAAIRTTLADAGQDGWGAAATASSAALGALFLLLITVVAALAYSIAGSGNHALTSGLNDIAWAGVVLSSFPRAMLIMARGVRALAGRADLERALRGGGRSRRAHSCWAAPRG